MNFLRSFFKVFLMFSWNFIKMSKKYPGNYIKNLDFFLKMSTIFFNDKNLSKKLLKILLFTPTFIFFLISQNHLETISRFLYSSSAGVLTLHNVSQKFQELHWKFRKVFYNNYGIFSLFPSVSLNFLVSNVKFWWNFFKIFFIFL